MLAKKKKLSKREIKEDKLVTSYFQVQQFIEEHQQKILMAVGAVILVVVLIFVYVNKVEQDNLAATTQLSRIMEIYNGGSYQEAIDGRPGTNLIGLKGIVDEFGGTEQGENARIMIANAHYYLGDYEVAEQYYSDYSGSNPLFKSASYAGRAACLEADGEFGRAADLYLDAANASVENPSTADYLLKAGINFKKVGKLEMAKELFQRITDDHSTSLAAISAKKYVAAVTE